MKQYLASVSILVRDYDEAIQYYTKKLGFILIEDIRLNESKRWVIISPAGTQGCCLLLAKAANPEQEKFIGNQTGGRVFLFLHTDNFRRDYEHYRQNNIHFITEPVKQDYGTVAVFEDLYGNRWDLVEPTNTK